MLSIESPQRGDSNEYAEYTIINIKIKLPLLIINLQLWDFSKVLDNEFETAVVEDPSLFESLKVHCNFSKSKQLMRV